MIESGGNEKYRVYQYDCLQFMAGIPDDYFDLTMFSPPYEDCRTYGIDFKLSGQSWVDWMVAVFTECTRVTSGLVVCVVEGKTRQFRWSATPVLLMADLHRAGIKLRKPPIYHRVGIPGGGGPDWWRNDYEFCICASKGKLPWSDNTATGSPTKYAEGGACTNRTADGKRVGSHRAERKNGRKYAKPKSGIANPGNVIRCKVGKGHMGSNLSHENEAPFPESLVSPFVQCFCKPGCIVFDPFCGSGTTGAVALQLDRRFVGCDVRASQAELTLQRLRTPQQ